MPAPANIVDDEIRKLWRQATRAQMFAHHLPALLGRDDGSGAFTIPVAAWPGFVYVRRFQAGALTLDKAINRAGVVEAGDLPIWLDRDADGRWIIVGERYIGGAVGVPVVARYATNAGQSIPNITDTIVNFNGFYFDPWGAVTTGASWKFTAPANGYYLVVGMCKFVASVAWAVGEVAQLRLFKNGSGDEFLSHNENNGATSHSVSLSGSAMTELAAGDYIDLRVYQATGGALALNTVYMWNHINIARMG